MPVEEASAEETPYGRYITSDGWFVLNLSDTLAIRNEGKGGAAYPLEPREAPFDGLGVSVKILWPGDQTGYTTPRACRKDSSCCQASAR